MNKLSKSLLDKCIDLFKQARQTTFVAMKLLYEVREKEAWEGRFSSFMEFVEEGLKIDKGQASRLVKVYEYYIVKGSVEPAQLREVNPEKLYKAINLPGKPSQKALRAATWSPEELEDELRDIKYGAHEHELDMERQSAPCRVCGKWVHTK